jgi:hypothetical protein
MWIVVVLFPLQFACAYNSNTWFIFRMVVIVVLIGKATRFLEAKKLQCHNMDILCIKWYFRGETITILTIQVCVPHFKTPLAQCKAVILKISVKLGKHCTGSLCLAHLQDVTSKTVPKNYTQAQRGLKLRFCAGLSMNWVSCWVSCLCIARRSPHLVTFLPLCLHLHLSSHVYFYACNGFGLHSSGSSNSLLPYITL